MNRVWPDAIVPENTLHLFEPFRVAMAAMGHFDPFPPPRLNSGYPFRRYVLVPWSAARPDVQ